MVGRGSESIDDVEVLDAESDKDETSRSAGVFLSNRRAPKGYMSSFTKNEQNQVPVTDR